MYSINFCCICLKDILALNLVVQKESKDIAVDRINFFVLVKPNLVLIQYPYFSVIKKENLLVASHLNINQWMFSLKSWRIKTSSVQLGEFLETCLFQRAQQVKRLRSQSQNGAQCLSSNHPILSIQFWPPERLPIPIVCLEDYRKIKVSTGTYFIVN